MIRAGRTDDDVDTASQRGQLHAVALSAVDGEDVHALHLRGIGLECLAHLERELTGGSEHERLRDLLGDIEAFEDGKRESGGLTRSGLCLADDVAAVEKRRNGRRLDGRRGLVAEVLDGFEDGPGDAELLESGGRGGVLGASVSTASSGVTSQG